MAPAAGQKWRDHTPAHVAARRAARLPPRVLEVDEVEGGYVTAHNVETEQVSVIPLARFVDEVQYQGERAVVTKPADFRLVA